MYLLNTIQIILFPYWYFNVAIGAVLFTFTDTGNECNVQALS